MTYIFAAPILAKVAQSTGAPVRLITSRQRHPELTAARALAVRELRAAGYSYPEIGRILGGRHYSTIMYLDKKGIEIENDK